MQSKAWARTWSVMRIAMAAFIVAAVVAQLAKTTGAAIADQRDVATTVVNFFSFFTILSNTATAVILTWAAVWFFTRGRHSDAEPPALALALASVTTYMIVTGAVYNTLLRGVELLPGSEPVPWSNEVLHLVAPIFLLVDLFVGPLRRALPWRAIWGIVAFPLVWVAYTLLRGPLVVNPITEAPYWYPYPFLDPNGAGGWPSVLVYVVGIAAAVILVAALVVWWGRRAGRERALEHETGDDLEAEWQEAREAQKE